MKKKSMIFLLLISSGLFLRGAAEGDEKEHLLPRYNDQCIFYVRNPDVIEAARIVMEPYGKNAGMNAYVWQRDLNRASSRARELLNKYHGSIEAVMQVIDSVEDVGAQAILKQCNTFKKSGYQESPFFESNITEKRIKQLFAAGFAIDYMYKDGETVLFPVAALSDVVKIKCFIDLYKKQLAGYSMIADPSVSQKKFECFFALPVELQVNILEQCDCNSIAAIKDTCKVLRKAIKDTGIQEKLVKQQVKKFVEHKDSKGRSVTDIAQLFDGCIDHNHGITFFLRKYLED